MFEAKENQESPRSSQIQGPAFVSDKKYRSPNCHKKSKNVISENPQVEITPVAKVYGTIRRSSWNEITKISPAPRLNWSNEWMAWLLNFASRHGVTILYVTIIHHHPWLFFNSGSFPLPPKERRFLSQVTNHMFWCFLANSFIIFPLSYMVAPFTGQWCVTYLSFTNNNWANQWRSEFNSAYAKRETSSQLVVCTVRACGALMHNSLEFSLAPFISSQVWNSGNFRDVVSEEFDIHRQEVKVTFWYDESHDVRVDNFKIDLNPLFSWQVCCWGLEISCACMQCMKMYSVLRTVRYTVCAYGEMDQGRSDVITILTWFPCTVLYSVCASLPACQGIRATRRYSLQDNDCQSVTDDTTVQ